MRLARLWQLCLFITLLAAPKSSARLGYVLKQTPITLGAFDPKDTVLAKISPNGQLIGQIDSLGNARIWAFEIPSLPILELTANPTLGQVFINIEFSRDSKYIIFDSSFINTGLATVGRVVVVPTDTFLAQEFATYVWGGTQRSKYALSSTGLFAFVRGAGGHIAIFDFKTRAQINLIETTFASISALAFDPLAQKLAVKDIVATAIHIIDVKTGQPKNVFALETPMPDDEFSPDQTLFYWGQGRMLAVNSDPNELAISDAQNSSGQFPFEWFEPLAMFSSNDSNTLAVADDSATLNFQRVGDETLYEIVPFGFFDMTVAGAFSPRDQSIALGSATGNVAVYDAKLNFQCGSTLTKADEIMQIAYTNERQFFSVTVQNMLTRWDIIQL